MRLRKLSLSVLVGFASLTAAEAYTPPTETGESGLLTLPTTATLPPGRIHLGAFTRRDIESHATFEPGLGGIRDTDLQQNSFVAGVGILDNLELSVQVPWVHYQIDRPGEDPSPRDLGQVRITPKFRLMDEEQGPFGLAIQGAVALPTGDDSFPAPLDRNTLLNEEVNGEVLAVLDKELFTLPGNAPVVFTMNVGGLFLQDPDQNALRIENQIEPVFAQLRRKGITRIELEEVVLQGGAGLQVPLWKDYVGQLDLLGEFRGNSGTIEDIDEYRAVLAGVRYGLYNGLAVAGGVDFGLSNSVDRYAFLAGLSYTGPQPPPEMGAPGKEKVVYRDRVIEVERIMLFDVNFEFDKATLTNLGRGQVYLIAQKLREGKSVKVEIHGHTDYIGTEDYNKALGLRRAETVKAELVKLGVDPTDISTVSFGEDKPLIDMETPWARAVNRRTEFIVVGEPREMTREAPANGEAEEAPLESLEETPEEELSPPEEEAPLDEPESSDGEPAAEEEAPLEDEPLEDEAGDDLLEE